jgi:broad specificity phosphatase PhoE
LDFELYLCKKTIEINENRGYYITKFYFIRHGETDFTLADTKIYKNWGFNMLPLSNKGEEQIKATAKDKRLKSAKIIVSSPYGRAMHSAAIISKELGIDLVVETNLHEWVANIDYNYIPDDEAKENLKEFFKNDGEKSNDLKYNYETAYSMKDRVYLVLEKYKNYGEVIIVCHGLLMERFLDICEVSNGEIVEYILE